MLCSRRVRIRSEDDGGEVVSWPAQGGVDSVPLVLFSVELLAAAVGEAAAHGKQTTSALDQTETAPALRHGSERPPRIRFDVVSLCRQRFSRIENGRFFIGVSIFVRTVYNMNDSIFFG